MSATENKAVFLSYASQDAAAVSRIADALRASGVEVWFDQNELVGGDAWDQKIRKQIKECALFVPVISANTQARTEGYFRLEWRLADQRTHLMAKGRAFLLPIVIDATRDAEAHVPDSFTEVQWTRLPDGETPEKFCARVKALLEGAPMESARSRPAERGEAVASASKPRALLPRLALGVLASVVISAALYFSLRPRHSAEEIAKPIAGTPMTAAGSTANPAPAKPPPAAAPLTKAQQLIVRARALYEPWRVAPADDLKLAERLLKEANELEPANADGWASLAVLSCALRFFGFDSSDDRRALVVSAAERAARLAPDSPYAQLALGLRHYQDPATREDAARIYRTLAERPDAAGFVQHLALIELATGLFGKHQSAEALATLELAASRDGGDPSACFEIGAIHLIEGRFEQAVAADDRAIALRPDFGAAHAGKLVILLFGLGDLARTRAALQQIPARTLRDDRIATIAMLIWLASGEPAKAADIIRQIPGDYLESEWAHEPKALMGGVIHDQAGRRDAAVAEWKLGLRAVEQRLATSPTNRVELGNKAKLLALLGERTQAEETLRLIEQLSGQPAGRADSMTWYIYSALGREMEVADYFEQAMKPGTGRTRFDFNPGLLKFSPAIDPFRSSPRFVALLQAADLIFAGRARGDGTTNPSAVDSGKTSPAPEKSVAVLAFDNRSDDKDAEYFSDGISEELINALGRVPGLTVKGRTSAFFFKGKNATAQEIAEKLGVNYLVRGSVRKAGGKVRITAQLSRAATDEIVWSSEPLEREVKDVFAVQDEIVGLIAKSLSVQMGVPSRAVHQVNPDALTALLQGREFWVLRTPEGFARARVFFNQAVTLDPDWASAHAALASLEAIEASFLRGDDGSVDARMALATREAKRALELDATLAEPHATLGKIAMEYRQHGEAEQEFRRALALEPNNALVHDWYGDFSVTQGRLDVAIAEYGRAMELEPLSPYIMFDLAWEMMNVRRYREALALVERAATLTPSGTARYTLRRARLLLELGRNTEAEAALHSYLESPMTGSDPQFLNEAAWCLRAFGSSADRERVTAELLRKFPDTYPSGVILLMLGQHEKAFPLLKKVPPIFVQQIYWEPVFDPVRDTPRFRQLLEKIGSTEQYHVARETQARLLREQAAKK